MLLRMICLLGFAGLIYSCLPSDNGKMSEAFKERMYNKLYPNDGHYKAKNYPFETFGLQAYKSGLKQAVQSKDNFRAGEWTQQGPGNIGGRVNTVVANPNNPNEMMLGYSIGGIHKTINGGASWYPVFENELTLSLSDIIYDPSNTNVCYAGTGDLNITGFPVSGNGIYKSEDGGESWTQSGLVEAGVISEVAVSHQNSEVVYAASMGVPYEISSDRGLYKSTDGGQTWEKKLFINGYTGIIDIEVSTTDENIIYAASWSRISAYSQNVISSGITRILKSEDGGESWNYLTKDLPDGTLVRPGLAMFPGDHNIVYAMFSHYVSEDDEEADCNDGYYIEGVYKTEDGGESWLPLDTSPDSGWRCNFVGGFSWYFGKIRVNPFNPNDIFVLGVDMMRSRDGGVTWQEATPRWWTYEVHADKHDLTFNGPEMILATDGGAYKSFLEVEEWQDIEDIISTQFYRVAYNPHEPEWYYGGAQDNGTTGGNSSEVNNWPRIFGADGFGLQFHPTDSSTYYVETQNGRIFRYIEDENGSQFYRLTDTISDEGNVNWDMPYFIGSDDPNIVYCGREKVWRTINDEQDLWESMSPTLIDENNTTIALSHNISALGQSTIDGNMFFAGTSDGYLWRTLDNGTNWDRVGLDMPERYYSDVRPSPNDASRVYASITGYKNNDNTPYIYMSQDSGRTYIDIAGDMPSTAVNDIYIPADQDEENMIVIGTDAGVYVTLNSGKNWFRLGNNMPVMPIFDLSYNKVKEELIAGSHALGIWTIPMEDILSVSTKNVIASLDATVYPTVALDYISVFGESDSYKYAVYSLDGKLYLSGHINKNEHLSISQLSQGYYIIQLQSGQKAVSKKFIKR